ADGADRSDHRVHRTPGMHDHRQPMLARQCELALEIALLRVVVETLDEIIEPALADGDGALALDPVAQLREVPRAVFREEHRMQAVCGEQPVRAGADRAQLRPACGVDRGYDLARDPRGAGPGDHLVAI